MADIRPTGTATSMAMKEMSSVPTNSGMAPKAPDAPTWSARMAICGLHSVPKRKPVTGTAWKKRIDSNSTESTIPMVVRMAIVELTMSRPSTIRSTEFRARLSGSMVRQAMALQNAARASTATQMAMAA